MNVARFIAFCGKLEYGRSGCIFAYISVTTRARDFKFAGTPVQRLQLAMIALTQKSFSVQYAWFSRGRSHMTKSELRQFLNRGTKNAHCANCALILYEGFSQFQSQMLCMHIVVVYYEYCNLYKCRQLCDQ